MLERFQEQQRDWRAANAKDRKLKQAAYAKKHAVRGRLVKKKLPVELVETVKEHCGVCDLCGGPPVGRWKSLVVDHCHSSGKYRGMLCSNCNVALGLLKDDPELMEKAAMYIREAKT